MLSEVVLAAVGTVTGVAPEPPVGPMGLQVPLQMAGGGKLDPAESAGGFEGRAEDPRRGAPSRRHCLVGGPAGAGARHLPRLAFHVAQPHWRGAAVGDVVRGVRRVGGRQVGVVSQGRKVRGVRRGGVRRHAGLAVHGRVRGLARVRRVDRVRLRLAQVGGGGRVVDRGAVGEGASLGVAEGRQRPRRAVRRQGGRGAVGGIGAVGRGAPTRVRERWRRRGRGVVGDVLPGVDLLRGLRPGGVRLRGVVVGRVHCCRGRGREVAIGRPLAAAVAVPLRGRGLGGGVAVELLDVGGHELGAVAGGGGQLDVAVHGGHAPIVTCNNGSLVTNTQYRAKQFSGEAFANSH